MPDLMPSIRTTGLVRRRRRALFVVPDWADGISDRTLGFGKRAVDAPGSTMKSWAELAPDMANTVPKRPASAVQSHHRHGRSGALAAKVPI
jgi:hypothetical protein